MLKNNKIYHNCTKISSAHYVAVAKYCQSVSKTFWSFSASNSPSTELVELADVVPVLLFLASYLSVNHYMYYNTSEGQNEIIYTIYEEM